MQMERELYYYGALLGIVRDAIGPNGVISRIGFRNPMLSEDGSFVFGLVEISDDASMGHMYSVMRQFPTLQLIQLFVEVDTCGVSPQFSYGSMPSQTPFEAGSCSDLLRRFGASLSLPEDVRTDDRQTFPEEDDAQYSPEDDEAVNERDEESVDDIEQEDEEDDEEEHFYDDESNDDGDDENLAILPSGADDLFDQHVQNESRSPDYVAYHSVNIDDMVNDRLMHISNDELWHEGLEFKIGMIFSSRENVKTAVKLYSVKRKREFRAEETRNNTIALRCHIGKGCQWRLRATEKKSSGYWTITKYGGPHTCVMPSDRAGMRNFEQYIQRGTTGSATLHYHGRYMEWYRRITRRWIGIPGASIGASVSVYIFPNTFILLKIINSPKLMIFFCQYRGMLLSTLQGLATLKTLIALQY